MELKAVEPDTYMIPDPDADVPPTRPKLCAVEGCENEVAETPTGRKGKYCAEHKSAPKSGEPRVTSTRGASWPKAKVVEDTLNMLFRFGGGFVVVINRADGEAITAGGPAVSRALVDLGRNDKKVRRYLEMLAAPGKYGPLTVAVAGIVIPILVNHDLFPKFTINVPESTDTPEGVN